MSHTLATYEPEDIHLALGENTPPVWARLLMDRLQAAAAAGQRVTVTAEDRLLSPREVGERLNMHRSTITRKILSGQIRAVQVGNRHRIPYTEYVRFRDAVLDDIARASAPDVAAELFSDR